MWKKFWTEEYTYERNSNVLTHWPGEHNRKIICIDSYIKIKWSIFSMTVLDVRSERSNSRFCIMECIKISEFHARQISRKTHCFAPSMIFNRFLTVVTIELFEKTMNISTNTNSLPNDPFVTSLILKRRYILVQLKFNPSFVIQLVLLVFILLLLL